MSSPETRAEPKLDESATDGPTMQVPATLDAPSDALPAVTQELPRETPQGFEAVPGQHLGRYRIEKLLGRGGMGSVFLALDTELKRSVALKIPSFSASSPPELVERFFREARAAATLSHPNICPVHDVGECQGTRFLAMGYIEGRPLSDFIVPGKLQPERNIAILVRKLALALQEAHDQGIVHRDLKPGNVIVNKRNEPIVMDFGLARRVDDEADSRLTKDGTVVGTPAYMSPEQVSGDRGLGPPTDIYSLGVILFELLTGKLPFTGGILSVLGQILHSDPPSIPELRTGVSPQLVGIATKAMAKKPADRYASMKEFADALAGFLSATPEKPQATIALDAPPPAPAAPDPAARKSAPIRKSAAARDVDEYDLPAAPPKRTMKKSRARAHQSTADRIWMQVAGVAGGLLLVIAGVWAFSGSNTPLPESSAPVTQTATNPVNNPPVAVPASTETPEAQPAVPPDEPPVVANAPVEEPEPANAPPSEPEPPAVASNTPAPPATPPEPPTQPQPGPPMPPEKAGPPPQGGPGNGPPGEGPRRPWGPTEDYKPTTQELAADFEEWDGDSDGKLDPHEFPMHIIQRADKNRDRKLTKSELQAAYKLHRSKLFAPPADRQGFGPDGPPPGGPRGKRGPRPGG